MTDFALDEQQLEALRPLAAAIEGAITDTPIRLGTDDWGTMLASAILVRVAAYMGGVLPPVAEPGDWIMRGTRDLAIPERTAVPRTEDALTTCNEPGPWGDAHACILPTGHPDDHQGHDGCGWRTGLCGTGQHQPHPGFTCAEVDQTRPYWNKRWEQEQQATGAAGRLCVCGDPIEWWTGPGDSAGWVHIPTPGMPILDVHKPRPTDESAASAVPTDSDEQTLRWMRRESLLVLLTRLQRGRTLSTEEAGTLRQHVETEIREANTARSVAAGNKRHVQVMHEELRREQDASKGLAGKIKEQRTALDVVRGELTAVQAAIERVRALADQWDNALAPARSQYSGPVRAALDGTEQQPTEGDNQPTAEQNRGGCCNCPHEMEA